MKRIARAILVLLTFTLADRAEAQDAASTLPFQLPEHDLYPENIAHDPVSGDYFLGSMSRSRILPDGTYDDFVAPGPGGRR